MYQDIAVARGSTYDTLNKRMDRCQENIETVSDDIQRLQGGTNIKKTTDKYQKGVARWDKCKKKTADKYKKELHTNIKKGLQGGI